jgi:hypothetical protein
VLIRFYELRHLTVCVLNTHRGLSKKRRELVELEESTKLLRNQVKAKKQNIATLEDLLKEANRTREKELRKLKKGGDVTESQPAVVKFFIAGPEGLCVEFVEKRETSVAQLLLSARQAFISRRDHEVSYDSSSVELRLVFKGKLLLADQTIEECSIREGDTLMALLIEHKQPSAPAAAPAPQNAPAPVTNDSEKLSQLLEYLSKQQQDSMKEIATDIKYVFLYETTLSLFVLMCYFILFYFICSNGWKTALETITSTRERPVDHQRGSTGIDPQVLADMNSQWSRAQGQLQSEIEALANKVCVFVVV